MYTRLYNYLTLKLLPQFITYEHSSSHWFYCGFETLLLGGACATIAYNVGQSIDNLVGES